VRNRLLKVWRGTPHLISLFAQVLRSREFGFSFNLADRCPVSCDCYWRAMGRVTELKDEEVIEFFHARKAEGKQLVTIVGGEPYVRRDLLPKVTPIMPSNWVVTSATTPLLHLPKTTHFISIDGKDAETHDAIRKTPGLYYRVMKNLATVRANGPFPAFLHSVLNRVNYRQIRDMLHAWQDNNLSDGVVFSTITRIEGSADDLLLSADQQRWIVDELLRQKEEFGDFLCMSPRMICHMGLDALGRQIPQTCGTAKYVSSYDASGRRIQQCIFSEKGDCSKCGCIITSAIETLLAFPPSLGTMRVLARLFTP